MLHKSVITLMTFVLGSLIFTTQAQAYNPETRSYPTKEACDQAYLPILAKAKKGDAWAQYQVGTFFYGGCKPLSAKTAKKWYTLAYKNGVKEAKLPLLTILAMEEPNLSDTRRRAIMEQAAKEGVLAMQLKLGEETWNPNARFLKFNPWYLMAAKQGNSKAQKAVYLYYIAGNPNIPFFYMLDIANDGSQAFYWAQELMKTNPEYGVVQLARCYYLGLGVKSDKKKGIAMIEEACLDGNEFACSVFFWGEYSYWGG